MQKRIAATVIAASALTGGAVGLTLFGPSTVGAKTSPSSTAATQQAAPATAPGTADKPAGDHRGFGRGHGRFGGAAAAKAIGISESDLTTALRSGKTIAQVAKAHGVALQKVTDALVADGKTKLAAAVKAGRLTQAQADKIQLELTKRVTEMVNGTFHDGEGKGFGGPGLGRPGFGGPGRGLSRPTAAAAKAIGISESDLTTALRSGKTIAQIAKAHGVALQKVTDALVADGKTKLAAAVKAGRLTQAQADKIQLELTKRVTEMVNGTFHDGEGKGFGGPGLGRPGFGGPGRGLSRPTAAAAKAIGISESDLTTALRSGKTIAQVAKAHGVALQKVIDALVADGKTKLAAAVKAGRLTQAQADKIQSDLTKRVTEMVNGTFRHDKGGPGFGGGHGGPRFDRPGA